ncbi:hypothetical protein PsorP6_013479 [Peronosclerospora sorghi]|uniref:Uncharacterized protein n=1 Tax=Peronosclerospora sorghi TaxID=230839 RepID=A0ACC0VHV8_9STRA|nr:hypothetical protein PsorP6_013479 [Peronosclerospora sorghi]
MARKGLLARVQTVKPEVKGTEKWVLNDKKALGLIVQGIAPEHHTKIRSETTAIQAWRTLRELYNSATLPNRVSMTLRIHDFKMDDCAPMSHHLD